MRRINYQLIFGIIAVAAVLYYSYEYSNRRKVLLALRAERERLRLASLPLNSELILPASESLLVLINCEKNTDQIKENIKFFINHGLHDNADFLFVNNGGQCSMDVPQRSNTFVWNKEVQCAEHGIWALGVDHMKTQHQKKYSRFIYIDPIVRGPLLPREFFF
eukprot:TRINITY_DN4117_c0_g1_i2.p1 TRINITY_DN4117_c0_g1~~TRINITY_DN4117_c0_g1_i2.p1  ORF type:complete len:163 (-),score=27.18 TRINITY_DN4117_c0_g1_i2:555-1043(-)